jgi:hypothetical protein
MSDVEQFQMTKPAPIVWAHVIIPRPERRLKNGEMVAAAYETTFLLSTDHPDLKPIKAIMAKVATNFEAFADRIAENKKMERAPLDGIKFPLENGNKIADKGKAADKDREFARGMALLKAKSNVEIKTGPKKGQLLLPPRLVVLQNNQYVRYSEEHERGLARKFFYSGVLAIGTFGFSPYAGMGGGVAVYLNEILSLNAGEKINTGVDDEAKYGSADQFKDYVGRVSAEDPTEGAGQWAEQIPF